MKRCRPGITPFKQWPQANHGFYSRFLAWLREGAYSDSAVNQYAMGARIVLGLVNKPYWMIDPQGDVDAARAYLQREIPSEPSRGPYLKGVAKLEQFLRQTNHKPSPEWQPNWAYHLAGLPDWLASDVRAYLQHQRRGWMVELAPRNVVANLSRLARFLRWAASRCPLDSAMEFTPALWYDYADERLAARIKPETVNGELQALQGLLRFVAEQDKPVRERMLRLEMLPAAQRIPKDVSPEKLRILMREIERLVASSHAGFHRMGLVDRAWFLLMLHCGLRSGEVRRLRRSDLDLERRTVRIEQSKGLKDRTVYLSQAVVQAVSAYLEVRGPSPEDYLFLNRHLPLTAAYCYHRLATYAERCGVRITPHQLRHSCATLLLNAGAPILTVQAILGHQHVHTTLGYARLYDGTVAADYYRAMGEVEMRLDLGSGEPAAVPGTGPLLALVDSLSVGTLNDAQRRTVQALRAAIVEMVERVAPGA